MGATDEFDRPYSLLLDSAYPEQIAAELAREHRLYLNEALRLVAAGESPSEQGLSDGIRAATSRYRLARPYLLDDELDPAFARAEQSATAQLAGILATHQRNLDVELSRVRAQASLKKPFRLKARATITGTLDVSKEAREDGVLLSWKPGQQVFGWTLRVATKDKRARDYTVIEELSPATEELSYLLPLSQGLLYRLHILGLSRSGKVIERSLISSLSAQNQRDKWLRRPTSA